MADEGTGLVRVEGLNELVRTLRRAGRDLEDLKDANRRAGEIAADAARGFVPERSGRLAGSIRTARQARLARVQAGRASIPYAGPIHWGWPARHIRAQPFLSEGAVESEPRWTAVFFDDVQRALDKVRGV